MVKKGSLMTYRKSTAGFPTSYNRVRTLPLSPPKGGSESDFSFFKIKVNFNQIKSATKFLRVKTSSGKVIV